MCANIVFFLKKKIANIDSLALGQNTINADHEMMRIYHVGELPLEQQGGTCGDSAAVSSFVGSGFLLLVVSSVTVSLALVVL